MKTYKLHMDKAHAPNVAVRALADICVQIIVETTCAIYNSGYVKYA